MVVKEKTENIEPGAHHVLLSTCLDEWVNLEDAGSHGGQAVQGVPGTSDHSDSHAFLSPPKLGRLLKIPVLKFLLHSASYLWFLIFLLGESLAMETQLSTFKGRSQSVWETSLHMIWVTGMYERALYLWPATKIPVASSALGPTETWSH